MAQHGQLKKPRKRRNWTTTMGSPQQTTAESPPLGAQLSKVEAPETLRELIADAAEKMMGRG